MNRFPLRLLPSSRTLTLILLLLWALLAAYIVATRDPLGYVILALVTIFFGLPALVLYLGNRGSLPVDHETRPDDEHPGSNGASGMQ